jgi:hypothetical protein
MYIFKQVFRMRLIFIILSSELYIKDKHSNGVEFSNGDCVINNFLITIRTMNYNSVVMWSLHAITNSTL